MITSETILKIVLSFFLGAIIGLERELKGKSAGFRTMILITTGSTIFTIISILIVKGAGNLNGDPSRIASGIVAGIGFIGAGVIFNMRGTVKGLTTGATVWLSGAIGMGVGAGYYLLSVFSTGLVLIVLSAFKKLEEEFEKRYDHFTIKVILTYPYSLEEILKKYGITKDKLKSISYRKEDIYYHWSFMFLSSELDEEEIIEKTMMLEGIEKFELIKESL